MIQDFPSIEKDIVRGSLNLTTVNQVHSHIRRVSRFKSIKFSLSEKQNLVQMAQGKSEKELAVRFASLEPDVPTPVRVRAISSDLFEIRFQSSQRLLTKLTRAREILAHSLQFGGNYADLIEKVLDIALEQIDPAKKLSKKQKAAMKGIFKNAESDSNGTDNDEDLRMAAGEKGTFLGHDLCRRNLQKETSPSDRLNGAKSADISSQQVHQKRSVFQNRSALPINSKRVIWDRDGGRCTYRDSMTGLRCGSRFGLEFDHIQPLAVGGSNGVSNLRILCRSHNQFEAIQKLGFEKMSHFVKGIQSS